MLLTNDKELERLLSWARYLYWSDLQRQRYVDDDFENEFADDGAGQSKLFALASLWFASVWVVIEGWKELRLEDDLIDPLLRDWPTYCDLLKRYRNGVYHFQPAMFDDRLRGMVTGRADFVTWIFALHLEFLRFLWEWPERLGGSKEQVLELRSALKDVIGWMPEQILPARKRALRDLCAAALRMVEEAGDTTSDAAKELIKATADIEKMLCETPDAPALKQFKRPGPSGDMEWIRRKRES